MQELDLSISILNEIIDSNVPFAESLRKVFQADASIRPLRSAVAGLVGCVLRHLILFDKLAAPFSDFTQEEKRRLYLGLANNYYYRRFDAEAIKAEIKESLGEEKFALCAPLFDKAGNPDSYIPEDVAKASNEYLSLRYNVPIWVIKVLEHFGYSNTYKTLRVYVRPAAYYLRARDMLNVDELLASGDYEKTPVEKILLYKGKNPLRKVDAYREGKLFDEKPFVKWLIENNLVQEPQEVLLYNGNASDSLERELIETYGDKIGMNIGVKSVDEKLAVSRLIKEKGLHNVNFFSADPLAMEASISRPQDLVIVSPDSTNFDLIPLTPDYLLHFDKPGMDALFENQKKALEGCAKYVEVGGKLVYVISTISQKEGHSTIASFLRQHEEFVLVEEKQHFPFEELSSAFYVAILQKKEKVVSAEPPIGELSSIASKPSVSASAAAK